MTKLNDKKINPQNKVLIYKAKDGHPNLLVKMEGNSVWLTQQQIAVIFDVQKAAISKHIKNIFNSGELKRLATVSILETVQKEGLRNIVCNIEYYNFDLILSIGYRVNLKLATQFRIWATNVLMTHIVKGYTINECKLKDGKNLRLGELQETINFCKWL